MKVIQWLDKFNPPLGGGPTVVRNMMKNMPEIEFELLVNAVHDYPLMEKYSENGMIHSFLPYDIVSHSRYKGIVKPIMLPYKVLSEYLRFKNKTKYLQNTDYDIFHLYGPGVNYGFSTFDRVFHMAFLQKITNFSFIKKPKLFSINGWPSESTNNRADQEMEKRIFEMFENIISPCNKHFESIKVLGNKNIFYVPLPIDTKLFDYKPLCPTEKLKICFLGRLTKYRGIDLLLQLINNLPEYVDLTIVCSGKKDVVDDFKSKVNSSRVKIYINIPNEKVKEFLYKTDVLLNPVLASGAGNATLESMSCGRPVIMIEWNKFCDRYPVINNKTGFIIKNDIHDLLKLLENLYTDYSLIKEMSNNGREILEKEFDKDVVMQKMRHIYKSLI